MSVSVSHRTTITHYKKTHLPIPIPPPLPAIPRAATTVAVAAELMQILWACIITYPCIMAWPLNTVESWYHPCGSERFKMYNVGQTLKFRVKGDPSKNCNVVVIEKMPLPEYSMLKGTKSVGPFTAEAEFPWVKNRTSDTYLVLVKRI